MGLVFTLIGRAPGRSGTRQRILRQPDAGDGRRHAHRLGQRTGAAVPGAGADLDPDVRPALPRPPRPGVGRSDDEVLLPQHPLVGAAAVRLQLLVRHRQDDADRRHRRPSRAFAKRWPVRTRANPLAPLAPLALVLVVAGLGFKLAVAPLQFYAPDVYQGTTNANAGLLGRRAEDRRRRGPRPAGRRRDAGDCRVRLATCARAGRS